MLMEEEKLRWLGIDMRARWRRRVAVIGTYTALCFLCAFIWGYPIDQSAHPYWWGFGMSSVSLLLIRFSVLRENGVVKRFAELPALKVPADGEMVLVNGLDEWAQYRYGAANFEVASEEQKADLLLRYRVGTFAVPSKFNPARIADLDERERTERDRAERWTLKYIASFLAAFAGLYLGHAARRKVEDPMAMAFEFWFLCLLAMTLPKARVLWTEDDPRVTAGEIAVIDVAHA